jgi:hypothetical protein
MMPANIVLKNLAPPPRYGEIAPLVDTDPLLRFGFRPEPPEPPPTGVIMSIDFNSAPDWHSEMYVDALDVERFASQGNILPVGAYAAYMNHLWTPARGFPASPVGAAILASNADKSFSGVGKSYVVQRQSNSDNRPHVWNSDDQLTFVLPEPVMRLYVEYMVKFDPNWSHTAAATSKMFRAGHWNGVDSKIFSGFQGGLGPMMIVDYGVNANGARNILSFRGGPPGTNYMPTSSDIGIALGVNSDLNLNYTSSVAGMSASGGNPQLTDKQNGGFLPSSGVATHNQVFGPPSTGQWTKIAFYMELNSAPNAKDGKFYQWIDDKRIFTLSEVCWYKDPTDGAAYIPKLNFFSIGGNDFFHTYPDEDRRSEWLSYDNVVIRHDIPVGVEV